MIKSQLLRDAICDARAVRVTAYANAAASLKERFDKRFEAVFAEKLKNEANEEEEEEGLREVEAPNQVSGTGGEAKGPKTKPVTKGNPKTPGAAAGDTDFKAVQAGLGPKDVPKLGKKVNETAEEEEEGDKKMDEQYEEEEEGKNEFSSEDLDEIIKELETEVSDEEEGKRVEEPMVPPTTPENGEEGESVEGEPGEGEPEEGEPHAEPDGDEFPGEEIPGEEPEEDGENPHAEPDGDEFPGEEVPGEEVPGEEVDVDAEPGSEVNIGPEAGQEPPVVPGRENQEEINLEELLAALNEEADKEEKEENKNKMDEMENNGIPKNVGGQDKTGGTNTYPKAPQDASRKIVKCKNFTGGDGQSNIGQGSGLGKPLKEAAKYKVALKEAYKTIEFLRGQINEVNLLNAKLLYTNKLFKEFANNIDEPYRMKIIENFDLTKSVREVKLVYASLAESLNFGSRKIVSSSNNSKSTNNINSITKKSIVKQITEGYASRPMASTKPAREIISECDVARFQKLAGIKKTVDPKK